MLASHITINADFFSQTHRISGRMQIGTVGLLGLLNDSTASLVEVENAYLSRLEEPGKIVAHYETIHLTKANWSFVILHRREDLGPLGRSGYTQIVTVPVALTLPRFEINGLVEITGKIDPSVLLAGGAGKYLPVFKAAIRSTLYTEAPFVGEAIALNRGVVDALAILPRHKESKA